MRTTLDIDDDVLTVVRHRARSERQSLGKTVSDLLRAEVNRGRATWETKNGLPVLKRPPGSRKVAITVEFVRQLQEETE
jgi:hypothetical protein